MNGSEGLRLTSCPADAVVLEYYPGLSDGVVADEIRRARPEVPIITALVATRCATASVDTLVDKSAGAHFLLGAVHFLLTSKADTMSVSRLRVAGF